MRGRTVPPVAGLTVAIVCAAVVVTAVDVVAWRARPGQAVWGALDESGHAATGFILACAVLRDRTIKRIAMVVAASVLIDLDHIPGFFGSAIIQGHAPRPYTHSIAGLVLVLAIAAACRVPARIVILLGAALALHFWRDLAEPGGPGLAFAWPVSHAVATIPYGLYAAVVGLLVFVALVRDRRGVHSIEERLVFGADPLP